MKLWRNLMAEPSSGKSPEMTRRERFLKVLDGDALDRVPMVSRLDIWHQAATSAGTLPGELAGLTLPEIEQKLGMGRSARFRDFCSETREKVTQTVQVEGDKTISSIEVDGHLLREIALLPDEHKRMGLLPQVRKHLLETDDDYRAMIRVWERTTLVAHHDACDDFDRQTGSRGLPVLVFTLTPFHRIMLEYAGYERFFLHQVDFPDLVEELQRVMEARYEAFWPELARSSMRLILHGAHWSSQMTPPPVFEKSFVPYVRRFTDAMHRASKKCACHADADLTGLLDAVLRTGMDVAECFACHPLVPLTLREARARWGSRVVIWGGFPSTLLGPSASEAQFHAYLDEFVDEISDGRAIIVGVSDNVMPDTQWERLVELCRRVAAIRPHTAHGRSLP